MNHINKPSGFNPMANSHHSHFGKHSHIANSPESQGTKSLETVSISEKSVVATKMVHQSISVKFTSIQDFNGAIKEAENELLNAFDFKAVAKNVMSFVNSSLSAAQSRGATTSELQEMLEQARQGANNGIDEAIEELGELNVLDGELSEGIEKARDLINAGLDETEEKLIGGILSGETSPSSLTSRAVEVSTNNYASQSNSSDLSITTADGDIVNISFSALEENQSSENLSYYAEQGSSGMSYQNSSSSYSEMNFSFCKSRKFGVFGLEILITK